MVRERFRWGLSLVCTFLVWGVMVAAGIIVSLLPEPWNVAPVILPAGAVLLIGVAAAHHWWTCGAWLIASPLLAYGAYVLAGALRFPSGSRDQEDSILFGVLGLGFGLALAVVATALAGLGVIIGQRRHGKGRDDVDLVTEAADLVEDAWALAEGTPADGSGPLPFGPINLPAGRPYTRGPDGHQAADPTYRRP